MKEIFTSAELEIVTFENQDVITASGPNDNSLVEQPF